MKELKPVGSSNRVLQALYFGLILFLTACGGGDESPTPTTISGTETAQFNGTYRGSANGILDNPDHGTDSFMIFFTVSNGVVSVPGPAGTLANEGTVSTSGVITFTAWGCGSGHDGLAVPYGTMTGEIAIISSGGATVTGTWSAPTITGPTGGCDARSGTWTATRE